MLRGGLAERFTCTLTRCGESYKRDLMIDSNTSVPMRDRALLGPSPDPFRLLHRHLVFIWQRSKEHEHPAPAHKLPHLLTSEVLLSGESSENCQHRLLMHTPLQCLLGGGKTEHLSEHRPTWYPHGDLSAPRDQIHSQTVLAIPAGVPGANSGFAANTPVEG